MQTYGADVLASLSVVTELLLRIRIRSHEAATTETMPQMGEGRAVRVTGSLRTPLSRGDRALDVFGQGSEWVAKKSQMMVLMSGPIGSANNSLPPPRGHW